MPDGSIDPAGILNLVQLVRDIGTVGLLVVAILGGVRGWYVWRREFDRLDADKKAADARADEWQGIALELLRQNDRATSIAETAVRK